MISLQSFGLVTLYALRRASVFVWFNITKYLPFIGYVNDIHVINPLYSDDNRKLMRRRDGCEGANWVVVSITQ